uniref:Secreted protein n=1 Tax=Panagrellus redivivus TaxID=6233 RepID=A0A7E4ZTY7_PANRE
MILQPMVPVFAAILLFVISGDCQQTFTCKGDTPSMKYDPCHHIREQNKRYPYARSYFDAIIQIAVKDLNGCVA